MSTDIAVYDRMQEVIDAQLSGLRPGEIAKKLGINIREVNSIIETWKQVAMDDRALKERAKEVLAGADMHYSKLIQAYYEIINEVDSLGLTDARMLAQKSAAIKGIADLEAKRFSMLKDMGLATDAETAAYQAELERKITVVEKVLRNTITECDHCRPKVRAALEEMANG